MKKCRLNYCLLMTDDLVFYELNKGNYGCDIRVNIVCTVYICGIGTLSASI